MTTEIDVTSAPREGESKTVGSEPRFNEGVFNLASEQDAAAVLGGEQTKQDFDPYSVDVEVGDTNPDGTTGTSDLRWPSTRPEVFQMRDLTREHALLETNPDAWLYARVAFLFFCALLISWVCLLLSLLFSLGSGFSWQQRSTD